VLDLNGASETVNGLSAVGPDLTLCVITNGSATPATLAAGDNNASSTFGGSIKVGTGVINLTKVGAGTLTLTAINAYTGTTTVSNGTLALTGSATISSSTPITVGAGATFDASGTTFGQLALASGQTLRGNGTVNGILIVASGATVSPGTSTGRLTVSSPVNLLGGSTALMELDAANGTNDVLASTSSINFNGTLTVTNINGTLAAGQNYKLFSGALAGNFAGFNFPILGGGLSWSWNPTTGILSVVGGGVNTTPTNIVSSASGGNLTMSWPADHIGWTLQVQTNSRAVGLNTNWFPVSGSSSTNQVIVPISSATPTVFYRLVYP
jgi:autotransporter-associated beta strand protein